MHNLAEVIEYTGLQTSQQWHNESYNGLIPFCLRIHLIWSKYTATELPSKFYQATMFGKLPSGTLGFFIVTGMLNCQNFQMCLICLIMISKETPKTLYGGKKIPND